MLKNPKKNKHYDADDECLRPLKIQKLMMTMKLDDHPPPPLRSIQEEESINNNRVRVRMRMELEEDETDAAAPPPPKKLRKVLIKTEEEEEEETRESSSRAWGDLPPQVLELIVKKLKKQFDYGSFLGVCKSWEKLKPDVVIRLELGDTVSSIPIRYKRF